jgi:hypothetical protein
MTSDLRVYWSILQDRALYDKAAQAFVQLASHNGRLGYGLIAPPYMRTDIARNVICRAFMHETDNPNSVLVMLDGDHEHPIDVVERLVNRLAQYEGESELLGGQRMGVLGGLYFRRSAPYDPLFFKRAPNGVGYMTPAEFDDDQIYESDHVGTGAIAIRRWVFDELIQYAPLYFKYIYDEDNLPEEQAGEDTYFANICERHGIKHWVDTGLVTKHLRLQTIDRSTWETYKATPGSVYENLGTVTVRETC